MTMTISLDEQCDNGDGFQKTATSTNETKPTTHGITKAKAMMMVLDGIPWMDPGWVMATKISALSLFTAARASSPFTITSELHLQLVTANFKRACLPFTITSKLHLLQLEAWRHYHWLLRIIREELLLSHHVQSPLPEWFLQIKSHPSNQHLFFVMCWLRNSNCQQTGHSGPKRQCLLCERRPHR